MPKKLFVEYFGHVDSNFKFLNRETLTKIHLPSHASARHQSAMELLQWGIDLFGVSMQGDGATIKRLPLINLLASGGNCPSTLLEIVDCTSHMAAGGTKSADYIAGLCRPHIERIGPKHVDLVLFDGASNVQKAGKLLQIPYPWITCAWSGEHICSLYLNDICNTKDS